MNIRDRKFFYALMTLIGFMGVLTSCHREDPLPTYETNIPITFAPSSDWPELATKATIYDETSDLADDGILVWGNLRVTNSNNTTDYPVFDEQTTGIKAPYPDWDYGEDKYWQLGNYAFVSVLPASLFKTKTINGEYTATWSDDFTTMSFDPSFDLKNSQVDLMTASAQQEFTLDHVNGKKTISAVNLDFQHTLSLLNITIINAINSDDLSITVNSVKIYGNRKTASTITNTGSWIYKEKSTSDSPFHDKKFDTGLSTSKDSNNPTTLVENLLVFPEESSMMYIEVNYTESLSGASNTVTRKAGITMDWTAGQTYTYQLQVTPSSLLVLKKTDEEWTPVSVTHTFK